MTIIQTNINKIIKLVNLLDRNNRNLHSKKTYILEKLYKIMPQLMIDWRQSNCR